MESIRYNEFKVHVDWENKKPVIQSKVPTKRGHVMISEQDAEIMNQGWHKKLIYYEKAEVNPEEELRKNLFKEADELGLKIAKNISTEKLQEKILKYKEQ